MALKAKQPEEVKVTKPKFMISGPSGAGKTYFSLYFPDIYFFDTEGGATREQYQSKLKESGGVYFGKEEGSQDFRSILQEIKELCTTKHKYKTIVIDSFTYLYLLEAADAEAKAGSEFGRDKKAANVPTRQLIKLLEKCDMNIILICHEKQKWERKGNQLVDGGTTFDGYDKLEYILDLWIEIGKGHKTFTVKKSRITGLPEGESFPLSYDKFADIYGRSVIESDAVPISLATVEQIERCSQLIEALKVPDAQIEKWFTASNVDEWKEMSTEQIGKCIELMEKRITDLSPKK